MHLLQLTTYIPERFKLGVEPIPVKQNTCFISRFKFSRSSHPHLLFTTANHKLFFLRGEGIFPAFLQEHVSSMRLMIFYIC